MKTHLLLAIIQLHFSLFVGGADIPEPSVRLVGAEDAEPHSAPFIVSLCVRKREGFVPYCGGSLLSEQWILTAAHCLAPDTFRIYALAGHHNLSNPEDTTQKRRADYATQHDEFDQIGPYDIGLIHVSRPFEVTAQVQFVQLGFDDDPVGEVTVFGWGSVTKKMERKFASILQTVNLTLVSNDYCESMFPVEIDDGNICAGLPDGEKGACVGDSGGPLMQNGRQVGIVSWGPQNCNPEDGPSVFTKIATYMEWIDSTMKSDPFASDETDDDVNYDHLGINLESNKSV